MNIAIFSDCYTPQINGVVTIVRTLKTELEKRGHNVYIFTVQHPDAIEEENVIRTSSIKFLNEPQHRIGLFIAEQMIKKVRSLNIDIIHTHTEFSLYLASRIVSRKLKIPSIHTMHTFYKDYTAYLPFYFLELYFRKNMGAYFRRIFRSQKCIVAPSSKIRNFLIDEVKYQQPVRIVPNGIDLSLFYEHSESIKKDSIELRRKYNIADNDELIVFVGRLGTEKNIAVLLDNFKETKNRRNTVKLLLVGDGPDKKALQERCYELGLSDSVIFTGYLRWPDEIRLVYTAADDSITGMVVNGENGWAVENDKKMWEKVIEILQDKEQMNRMGLKSEEISRKYSVDNFINNMLVIYEEYRKR